MPHHTTQPTLGLRLDDGNGACAFRKSAATHTARPCSGTSGIVSCVFHSILNKGLDGF